LSELTKHMKKFSPEDAASLVNYVWTQLKLGIVVAIRGLLLDIVNACLNRFAPFRYKLFLFVFVW